MSRGRLGGGSRTFYERLKHGVHQVLVKGSTEGAHHPYMARVATVRRLGGAEDYSSGLLIELQEWSAVGEESGFQDRIVWDDRGWRVARYEDDENDVVTRLKRGQLLVVSKESVYNAIQGTYDGRHNWLSASDIERYLGCLEAAARHAAKLRENPDQRLVRHAVAEVVGNAERRAGIYRSREHSVEKKRQNALACMNIAEEVFKGLAQGD